MKAPRFITPSKPQLDISQPLQKRFIIDQETPFKKKQKPDTNQSASSHLSKLLPPQRKIPDTPDHPLSLTQFIPTTETSSTQTNISTKLFKP